ncbi:MalY/PatB family protein [Schleiferilactobacillus harbinensis]|uniref:MalY/PatB family protein n=1 Tax=Schleiferilactobacillus harbinensis TaxID=304207 RepID=UPI0039ED26F2
MDFNEVIDRRGTNAVKWDVPAGDLPMWIADMDFPTAPAIIQAIQKKAAFGVFGYETVPPAYFDAVCHWYAAEHDTQLRREWLLYCTGVIPALSSIVRRVSHAGDNVVVQAPVYDIFYHSIENNGRRTLTSNLDYDLTTHRYTINWSDLEIKLADPLSTLMILCNPHNPIGKAWGKTDLQKIAALCRKYHVVLVSDEIHGDLVLGPPAYTPIFALPANDLQGIIALVSPSKSFNVAALHAATVVIADPALRTVVNRGLNNDELAEPNLMAVPATIAAYTASAGWLTALKQQLVKNRTIVSRFIRNELPQITLASENATYLLWLDIRQLSADADQFTHFLQDRTGLILSSGNVYRGDGQYFIRMNSACPPPMLQDGLQRLKAGVIAWIKNQQVEKTAQDK